jgi:hypothetical protein
MKNQIQSHRRVVEVPRDATTCEHPSMAELVECRVCEGRGVLIDAEQRRHYGVEPIPWDHPARSRSSFIEGLDR